MSFYLKLQFKVSIMKASYSRRFHLVATMLLFATIVLSQSKSDTTAIKGILQEEVISWNNGDAVTYSKHFAEDGTFTNIRGMFYTGYKEYLDRHDVIFKGPFKNTKLDLKLVSLKFINADVAIVETLTCVSGISKENIPPGTYLNANGCLYTRLLQVMVKNKNDWKIVTYHNVDLKPGTAVPE